MRCKQISKIESLNFRNTWESFLNVSLKMRADGIADRQNIQTLGTIIKHSMNKNVNPPCKSSLATSCAKSVMSKSCSEGRLAAVFTEGVSSSAEGELATDETASTLSLAPNVCVVPGVSAAVEEGEECVEEFVSHLSGEENAARHLEGEVDDNDSFVLMSGITAVGDAESEGRTFADALARANLSVEALAESIVDPSRLPTHESSFSVPH